MMTKVELHTFSGDDREIGVQQGRAVRGLIFDAIERIRTSEAVRLMKPELLPAPLFLMMARRRAAKLLKGDIFGYYPRQAQRLEGIAEGAGIDLSTILFMQSMELLVGKPDFRFQACTSLGFSSQKTATKETIVAKNFDYVNDFAPYHLTRETIPKEGYKTLGCTMAPLPGVVDGMNEYGLTVTYNLAYTTEKPKCFVPLSMALQEMLETCRSVDESVRFLTQAKRGGHDALLMLADAEGYMKTVEITSNHTSTREMTDGQIINTNHYLTEEMQQLEIPHNAVYIGRVPKELVDVRVHESSERRLRRVQELLKNGAGMDESTIIAILRDHGGDDKPSINTICRHGDYVSTLRSVIFYPYRKVVKVLYGNPCRNEYNELTFS